MVPYGEIQQLTETTVNIHPRSLFPKTKGMTAIKREEGEHRFHRKWASTQHHDSSVLVQTSMINNK